MPTSEKSSAKKSLLNQLPKRGRDQIALIMSERDGHLTLEQLLARNWNFEEYWRSQGRRSDVEVVAQGCRRMFSGGPAAAGLVAGPAAGGGSVLEPIDGLEGGRGRPPIRTGRPRRTRLRAQRAEPPAVAGILDLSKYLC